MRRIIYAVELPFPERVAADGSRRGQIHVHEQIVSSSEWSRAVVQSVFVRRNGGDVHAAGWICRCNVQDRRRGVDGGESVVTFHHLADGETAGPTLSVALP